MNRRHHARRKDYRCGPSCSIYMYLQGATPDFILDFVELMYEGSPPWHKQVEAMLRDPECPIWELPARFHAGPAYAGDEPGSVHMRFGLDFGYGLTREILRINFGEIFASAKS